MPTVLDSFTIELGLDPRKFTEGEREAMSSFKKTQEASLVFGRDLETRLTKISDLFGIVKAGALGVVGAFVGHEVAGFIGNIAQMTAQTGRLASSLGMATNELFKWDQVFRQAGSAPGAAGQTFQNIFDTINRYKATTGQYPPDLMNLLTRSNISINDFLYHPTDAFLRLSDYVNSPEIKAYGPGFGRQVMSAVPGASNDFFNVMQQGRKKLEEDLAKALPIRQEDVDAAKAYQDATAKLEVSFERLATRTFPALAELADYLSDHIMDFINGAHSLLGIPLAEDHETHYEKYLRTHPEEAQKRAEELARYNAREQALGRPPIPVKPGAGVASEAMSEVEAALKGIVGIKEITALADAYHQGFGSAHNAGRAMDVTVTDPTQSETVAASIEATLAARGIKGRVTNEYLHPSSRATGGHLHIEVSPTNIWPAPGAVPKGSFEDRWGSISPGAGAGARGSFIDSSSSSQHSSSVDVTIGTVVVQTQATDAAGMARDAAAQLRKNLAVAMNQNYSQQG